jgi:hypothetical protein
MKVHWGVEVYLHAVLTSALDGSEWSVSHAGRLTSTERSAGTHWIGGWVGPRVGLDAVVKRKIPSPSRTRIPDHLVSSPALYRQSYPGSPVLSL